jgi:hypothetical protein
MVLVRWYFVTNNDNVNYDISNGICILFIYSWYVQAFCVVSRGMSSSLLISKDTTIGDEHLCQVVMGESTPEPIASSNYTYLIKLRHHCQYWFGSVYTCRALTLGHRPTTDNRSLKMRRLCQSNTKINVLSVILPQPFSSTHIYIDHRCWWQAT